MSPEKFAQPSPTQVLAALAVLIMASWLYWPALQNGYVWDDGELFVDNPLVQGGGSDWDSLFRPIFATTSYIRPTVLWTFVLEARYGGGPLYSHLVNYAAYLLNVCLVMLLAHAHLQRRPLAGGGLRIAIAGMIYAIHPAQVETAAWASGRFDLFATTFVLIALLADLRLRRLLPRLAVVGGAFALALGSKELAVVLPGLLLMQRLALESAGGRSLLSQAFETLSRERVAVLVCLMILLAYFLIRVGATSGRLVPATTVSESLDSVWAHAAYVFRTVQFYAALVFAPLLGKTMPIHPALSELSLMPRQLAQSAFGLGVLMLLCAVLSLLPVLNIIVLSLWGNIGCDRFLTLPLVFVALAIAGASLPAPLRENRGVTVGLGVGLVVWSVAAVANVRASVPLWRTDATLWQWMYEIPAHRAHVRLNYTTAMLKESRFADVRAALEEALKERPLEASVQINYGYSLAMTNEPAEGAKFIEGALSVYPDVSTVTEAESKVQRGADAFIRDRRGYGFFALAEARLLLRDAVGALAASEKAIGYRPLTPDGHMVRGLALYALGRGVESDAAFSKAFALANPAKDEAIRLRRDAFKTWWDLGSGAESEVGNASGR
jgi:protein O-mannosyl-transferase